MTAPIFPAFIRLESANTDDAKAKFLAAVNQTMQAGESRTADFAATAQTNIDRALGVPPGATSAFTAEIDRMAVLATTKLDTIAASARRNFDAALSGRVTASGGIDVDVSGARQAAAVAERRAAVARQLAEATKVAALAERDFSQATRLSIAASKELADKEAQAATAARLQAQEAERLQLALDRAGVSAKGLASANDNLTRATGAQRQGMLQLGYQIGDVATMYSLGAKPAQIFASQIGQITQAVQLMTGGTSRLAAFLGGPWGIALSTATIVAAPFIGKLWETYSAANAATGALEELIKKQRQQQAEKNRVPNAQKDIDALVERRAELEAEIQKRGVRNPATGGLQFVFKQQKELKEVNAAIMEGRAALDAERAGTLTLDKAMGDLTVKRLKDSYATEKQTRAKVAKVKVDRDEIGELNKQLAAEIASIQKYAQWNEQGLSRGLDRGMAGMMDALASGQRRATNDLIKAADATGAWNDQLADTVRLLDQIAGSGRALGDIGRVLAALSGGNLDALPGSAGIIGQAIGGITWQTIDPDGSRIVRQLGDEFSQVLDRVFGGQGTFAKTLEAAGIGSAAGSLALGKSNSSLGSALGGILGKEAGAALGKTVGGVVGKALGPLGSIAGGILGGALGGLFKGVKSGYAQVRNGDVVGTYGRTGDLQDGAANVAAGLVSQISSIARTLNTRVGDYDFDIGRKNDKYVVNTGARGVFNFDTETEALEFAVREAVADGAFVGLSNSAKRLLQNGGALQDQIAKAVSFQGVFRDLKAFNDPLGAAIDDLNNEFSGLIDIFKEAGASAMEFANLEELYGKRRAEAVEDANERVLSSLKSLKSSLTIGSDFYSLRDRQASAQAVYNPLAARVAAGDSTAFDAFSEAAEQLLQIERNIFGSTGNFFARADEIRALTDQAINGKTALSDAAAASDSPFTSLASQQQATTSAIDAQTSAIVSALETQLDLRLDALNDNTIAVFKQLVANGTSSASALSALSAIPARGYF